MTTPPIRRPDASPLPFRAALAALLVGLTSACGGAQTGSDDAEGASSVVSETCVETLARVESFAGAKRPLADKRPVVAGGIADMAGGMNAFVSADFLANQHQIYLNLMTLVRFDDEFQLQPYLAKSWSLEDGGKSLTFHLRADVPWHDGEPTTAHDVAFTFERLVDPETGFPNASAFARYKSVEVIDPWTVRFTLEPHATALAAWRTVAIMPEHILGAVPAAELGAQPFGTQCPVGNGPFRFVGYVEGQQWHFAANPHFPSELGGPPSIGSYVYRVVPEESTLHLELLSGGIDLFVAPSPDIGLNIRAASDARLVNYPFRQSAFVAWNGRRPHLSDARVRAALTLGTNRQEIVDALLGGFGEVANTGVPPMHGAFDHKAGADMGYNPERAKRLLTEAGWTDKDGDGIREDGSGNPLRVEVLFNQGNGVRKQITEIMQAHLAQIGVQVVPTMLDWGAMLGRIMDPTSRDFDGVVMAWLPEFEMDESAFFHSEKIDEPLAWAGLEDTQLDAILEGIVDAQTAQEAMPLWMSFQERIVDLQPFTYLYFQQRLDGVSNRMARMPMDARGEWAQIQEWRVGQPPRALARR